MLMNFTNTLIKGKLVKRYKRFFTDIEVNNRIVTAHCPNTGSMMGLLDEGNNVKSILRPPWNHELVQDMILYPGTPTVERWKSQQLISFRSWSVEASIDFKNGDEGTILAHGDQGCLLYTSPSPRDS